MKTSQFLSALGLIAGMMLWPLDLAAQDAPPAAAPVAQPAATPPAAKASAALEPAVDTSAAPGRAGKTPAGPTPTPAPGEPASRAARARDRLELESTQITGNRELPKVLYIVPWKRSDLGDLPGKPLNSLLDEVLEPVDRDVFRRENRYYRALQPQSAPQAAPAAPE